MIAVNRKPIANTHSQIDIYRDYEYSTESSFVAYKDFITSLYNKSTADVYLRVALKIHKRYATLDDLNISLTQKGIIETSRELDRNQLAKVSAYLYFLAMLRLISFSFGDYYKVNPKTILRLQTWYTPYLENLGITSFCEAVKSVAERVNNRVVNPESDYKIAMKCCIYLVMRYKLKQIKDLTVDEWMLFLEEAHTVHNHVDHFAKPTYMQQAFYELGIFNERIPNTFDKRRDKVYTKKYIFDEMPYIKPVTDLYIKYCRENFKKSTNNHKIKALVYFFDYINNKYGSNITLREISRDVLYEYISDLKEKDCSESFKERNSYGVKNFLEFAIANKYELSLQNIPVMDKKCFIDRDFHIKATERRARPIDKEILNMLLKSLNEDDDIKFRNAVLIMAFTGLPMTETIHLTSDCVKKVGDEKYEMFYYREKSKRFKIVKIDKIVAEIIADVKKVNTQKKRLPHPNGKEEYYLFNDGGIPLDPIWFKRKFDNLKKRAIKENPSYEKELSKVVIYQLRHTYATMLRENGADIYTISKLMGHESINTTRIYVKESDERKIQLIKELNKGYICEALPNLNESLSGKSGDELTNTMIDIRNNMDIGICIVNGYENCPRAFKCLDCIYLCSTSKDIPAMLSMLKNLKGTYEDLSNNSSDTNKQNCKQEMEKIKNKMKNLCKKIEFLKRPQAPNLDVEIDDEDVLKLI